MTYSSRKTTVFAASPVPPPRPASAISVAAASNRSRCCPSIVSTPTARSSVQRIAMRLFSVSPGSGPSPAQRLDEGGEDVVDLGRILEHHHVPRSGEDLQDRPRDPRGQ